MESCRLRADPMRMATAVVQVADLESAKSFYIDYLGLSTEEFNLGWVAASPPGLSVGARP